MLKYALGAAFALFCCTGAQAACPNFPNTFSNGTTADANQVNANFATVGSCFAPIANPLFTGNVGIGTTTPLSALHVVGDITLGNAATLSGATIHMATVSGSDNNVLELAGGGAGNDSSRGAFINIWGNDFNLFGLYGDLVLSAGQATSGQGGNISFDTDPTSGGTSGAVTRMTITNAGNVGIGTTTPGAALTVTGAAVVSSNILSGGTVGWDTFGAGAPTSLCYSLNLYWYEPTPCTSLSQYKNNQRTLSLGLDTLMQLHPVEFDWDKQHGGHHDLGFIAQEVEKISPLLAEYDYKDNPKGKLTGVKYMQLTALLTKAVQELKAANDAQAAQSAVTIKALQAQNARLEAASEHLEAVSEHLEKVVADQQTRIGALERASVAKTNADVRPPRFVRVGVATIKSP